MLRFIYDAAYDLLAIVDVGGGVLLAAIWVQSGYVAFFRAIHGDDAGRASRPAPAAPAPRATTPVPPPRPWGAG